MKCNGVVKEVWTTTVPGLDPGTVVVQTSFTTPLHFISCAECERLALEYERLIQQHSEFLDEYYAAIKASDAGKMQELRFAVSGSRILGIRMRERLAIHQATHAEGSNAAEGLR